MHFKNFVNYDISIVNIILDGTIFNKKSGIILMVKFWKYYQILEQFKNAHCAVII
jgi:hypothetical protein